MRPFGEDIRRLVESHETRALLHGFLWVAADLRVLPNEDFMTGILGFAAEETFHDFEPDVFSWLKGPTQTIEGASRERTLVPFAVDLRENERWVAFGTTQRIQPTNFAAGFEATVNAAVASLGLLPSEWEVDLIIGKERVEEWLQVNPDVFKFTRTVRFHNPSLQLDADRKEMKALAAEVKSSTYTTRKRKSHLRIQDNEEFQRQLEGVDTGDLDVYFEARKGSGRVSFSSRGRADRRYVDDYGSDLERGMELMLEAVQEYAMERAGGQGGLL